jgi:aminomuconate-semialdehyde/2-hydroxymuconate-6-semialdehyde dehydrogenase
VEAGFYPLFVQRFTAEARRLRVGDPLEADTQQGAIISRTHMEKILSYVALARADGGRVLCGGAPVSLMERCQHGYFIEPTVIVDLPARCRVNQEEIFGPVVTITPFKDEEEAIRLANDVPFGLSASLWTRDLARAHRVAERLESGTVWINCWLLRDLRTPFGGMKHSGVGREGGDEALRFFTEPKNVCVKFAMEP